MAWGFLKRGVVPFAGETSAKAVALALKPSSEANRVTVLDLGSANENNFNFYSQIARKISFEDLSARIEKGDLNLTSDEPIGGQATYDTIICWDVFNYLASSEAEKLVSKIRAASHLGTRVVVAVANRPLMAEAPSNFRISDSGKILCEPRTSKMVAAPRYSPRTIARWFTGYDIIHSSIHTYGAEEYVFQYRGQATEGTAESSRAA